MRGWSGLTRTRCGCPPSDRRAPSRLFKTPAGDSTRKFAITRVAPRAAACGAPPRAMARKCPVPRTLRSPGRHVAPACHRPRLPGWQRRPSIPRPAAPPRSGPSSDARRPRVPCRCHCVVNCTSNGNTPQVAQINSAARLCRPPPAPFGARQQTSRGLHYSEHPAIEKDHPGVSSARRTLFLCRLRSPEHGGPAQAQSLFGTSRSVRACPQAWFCA